MTTFERRLEITRILISKKYITRTKLSEILGVSYETIGRDLAVLTRYLPINSKVGRRGCIYLDSDKYNEGKILSQEEVDTLEKIMDSLKEEEKTIIVGIIHKFNVVTQIWTTLLIGGLLLYLPIKMYLSTL